MKSLFKIVFLLFCTYSFINANIVGATKGEFSVNQGTAKYKLELKTPNGVNGLKPKLSINYKSSNNFNGVMGVGFSLGGISQIYKCNQDLFSEKEDSSRNYNYCFNGQKLVLKDNTQTYGTNTEYKTEIDSYSKIVKDNDGWTVYTKAGLKLEFGKNNDTVNTYAKDSDVVYRVNKISDKFENEITFEYDPTLKSVSKIAYADSVIMFDYQDRTDTKTLYKRGTSVDLEKRLKNIFIKKNENDVVPIYKYVIDYKENTELSRIEKISECVGNNCLEPIEFTWEENYSGDVFDKKEYTIQTNYPYGINGYYTENYKYKLGDFNGDGLTDMIHFVSEQDFQVWLSNGDGTFNELEKDTFNYNLNIRNFKTFDVNGDGATDLIEISGSESLRVWLASGDGDFTIKTTIVSSLKNPFRAVKYEYGDFNGDGLIDIYVFVNRETGDILLSKGDGTFTKKTKNYSYTESQQLYGDYNSLLDDISGSKSIDINSDGLTDIVISKRYALVSNGDGTFYVKSYNFPKIEGFYNFHNGGNSTEVIGDFNGDGISDVLNTLSGTTDSNEPQDIRLAQLFIGTGNGGFKALARFNAQGISSNHRVVDFNKDGLSDVIDMGNNEASIRIWLSNGDGTFSISSYGKSFNYFVWNMYTKPFWDVGDFNGDGSLDIISSKNETIIDLWFNKNKKRSVKNITNTRDENITITYSNLRDTDVYESTHTTKYPDRYIKASAAKVVKNFSSLNGVGNDKNTTEFFYRDFKINYERGALGFVEIESLDEVTNRKVITNFYKEFSRNNAIYSRYIYINDILINKERNDYTSILKDNYYKVYLKEKREEEYKYNNPNPNSAIRTKVLTSNIVDEYGNIKDSRVSLNGWIEDTKIEYNQIDESKWIIGNPTKVTKRFEYGESEDIKVNEYSYYQNTGALDYEIIEPNNPNELTKTYQYNDYGNITKETLSGSGMTSRVTNYTYDNENVNLKDIINTVTKPAKHQGEDDEIVTLTETRTYNDRDQIKTIKDISGLTTTFGYDTLGRKNKEIRPDTSSTEWSYDWIDGELEVIETVNGNFPHKTYFDRIGREIRKEKIGFDDVTTIEEFFYDAKGNKTLTYMPYFEGAIPEKIKYTYDDLNRLTKTDSPAPHNQRAIEEIVYDGFKTTKINALGQKKVTTLNALGKVALVEDNQAGSEDNEKGKIEYTYSADGSLSQTIENGVNKIIIYYDRFGNKRQQIDPDMGTWDYTYYPTGELKTQKDANGKIIRFEYDEIGRLTLKKAEQPGDLITIAGRITIREMIPTGESVSFEYDDISTNGKGKIHKEISVSTSGKVIKEYKYYDDGKLKDAVTTIYDSQEEGGMSHPYTKSYSYDGYGRVETIKEPNNVVMTNHYKGEYLDSVTTPRPTSTGKPDSAKLQQEISYATSQYLQNKTIVSQYNNQILEYEAKIARYKEIIDIYQNNPTKVNAITQIVVQVNELEELVETLQAVVDNYNEITGEPDLSGLETALSASDSAEVAAMYQNFQNELVKIAESSLTLLTEIKDKEEENRKLLYCGNIGGITIFCPDPMTEDNPNYSPEDNIIFYSANPQVVDYYQTALTALENDVNYINGINDKIAYYTNLENAYKNQEGIFSEIANDTGKIYFYKVVQKNALGITTSYVSGNGLVTKKEFDESGTLYGIKTGFETESDIRDLSFTYDKLKNVKSRAESSSTKLAYHHKFEYDGLNRVTSVSSETPNTINSHLNLNIDYEYDAIGNITKKSDVGFYNYDLAGPHAVTSIISNTGTVLKSFEYDANGNMIKNAGRKITYSSFNKPIEMSHGMKNVKFYYDANENRYKKYTNSETIHYVDKSYERIFTSSSEQHRYFIYADGKLVSIFTNTDGDYDVSFMHYDNLGSIDTITDHVGTPIQRFIYKPFGEKIVLTGQGELESSSAGGTFRVKRGFTGHEHIDEFDFIHMNGRVYDPIIGRFVSADPNIPYLYESQSFNRYSYTRNNPLKYVDPSGYFDFAETVGGILDSISEFFGGEKDGGTWESHSYTEYGKNKTVDYNATTGEFYDRFDNPLDGPERGSIGGTDWMGVDGYYHGSFNGGTFTSSPFGVSVTLSGPSQARANMREQEYKSQFERGYLYDKYGWQTESLLAAALPTPFGKSRFFSPPNPNKIKTFKSRRAAFRAAKRDAGIPTSQTHITHQNRVPAGSMDKQKTGINYKFGKKDTLNIQHHPKGHEYPDGGYYDVRHFNNHGTPADKTSNKGMHYEY